MQILEHLLKLRLATGQILDYNKGAWRASILRQQREIKTLLAESPSLRPLVTPDLLGEFYQSAAKTVAAEYDVATPPECPFDVEDVLGS